MTIQGYDDTKIFLLPLLWILVTGSLLNQRKKNPKQNKKQTNKCYSHDQAIQTVVLQFFSNQSQRLGTQSYIFYEANPRVSAPLLFHAALSTRQSFNSFNCSGVQTEMAEGKRKEHTAEKTLQRSEKNRQKKCKDSPSLWFLPDTFGEVNQWRTESTVGQGLLKVKEWDEGRRSVIHAVHDKVWRTSKIFLGCQMWYFTYLFISRIKVGEWVVEDERNFFSDSWQKVTWLNCYHLRSTLANGYTCHKKITKTFLHTTFKKISLYSCLEKWNKKDFLAGSSLCLGPKQCVTSALVEPC